MTAQITRKSIQNNGCRHFHPPTARVGLKNLWNVYPLGVSLMPAKRVGVGPKRGALLLVKGWPGAGEQRGRLFFCTRPTKKPGRCLHARIWKFSYVSLREGLSRALLPATMLVGGDSFRSRARDWSEALGAVLQAPSLIFLREHFVL